GPEVDEDDAAAKGIGRERVAVQPGGRARERGQMTLDRQDVVVPREAMRERSEQSAAGRRGDRRGGVVRHGVYLRSFAIGSCGRYCSTTVSARADRGSRVWH